MNVLYTKYLKKAIMAILIALLIIPAAINCMPVAAADEPVAGTSYVLSAATGLGTQTAFEQYKLYSYAGGWYDASQNTDNLTPLTQLLTYSDWPVSGGKSYYAEGQTAADDPTFFIANNGATYIRTSNTKVYIAEFTAPTCGEYSLAVTTASTGDAGYSALRIVKNGESLVLGSQIGSGKTVSHTAALAKNEKIYVFFYSNNANALERLRFVDITTTLTKVDHAYSEEVIIVPATYTSTGIARKTCACGASAETVIEKLSTDGITKDTAFSLNPESGLGTNLFFGQYKLYTYNGGWYDASQNLDALLPLTQLLTHSDWPVSGGKSYYTDGQTGTDVPSFFKASNGAVYIRTSITNTHIVEFTAPVCGEYSFAVTTASLGDGSYSALRFIKDGVSVHLGSGIGSGNPANYSCKLGVGEKIYIFFYTNNENALERVRLLDITTTLTSEPNAVHNYVAETVVTPATCTVPGLKTLTCECGEAIEAEIPVIAHTPGEAAKENETTSGYDIVTRCTECNEIVATEKIEAKINAANVEISDGFRLFFLVNTNTIDSVLAAGGSFELTVTAPGKTTVYTSIEGLAQVENAKTRSGFRYRFDCEGLGAQFMGEEVTAKLVITIDGNTYESEEVVYSILSYCEAQLAVYAESTDAKSIAFRTMLVDMLNYGAALQSFIPYGEDTLVNGELSETQKSWATAATEAFSAEDKAADQSGTAKWKSANVMLDGKINLIYTFTLPEDADLAAVKATVTIAGRSTDILGTAFDYDEATGRYSFTFTGINLSEVDEVISAQIFEGETEIGKTVTYSVEAYAAAVFAGTNEEFKTVAEAMMKFGRAVRAYVVA